VIPGGLGGSEAEGVQLEGETEVEVPQGCPRGWGSRGWGGV
jgi:hypothetical protein